MSKRWQKTSGKVGISALVCFLLNSASCVYAGSVSPRDCYVNFLTALYYARDISAVSNYFTKDRQDAIRKMGPEERKSTLADFKKYYVSKPVFVAEKIAGNAARLSVKGVCLAGNKPYNATVTVEMIKENGYWRVAASSCSGVVQIN